PSPLADESSGDTILNSKPAAGQSPESFDPSTSLRAGFAQDKPVEGQSPERAKRVEGAEGASTEVFYVAKLGNTLPEAPEERKKALLELTKEGTEVMWHNRDYVQAAFQQARKLTKEDNHITAVLARLNTVEVRAKNMADTEAVLTRRPVGEHTKIGGIFIEHLFVDTSIFENKNIKKLIRTLIIIAGSSIGRSLEETERFADECVEKLPAIGAEIIAGSLEKLDREELERELGEWRKEEGLESQDFEREIERMLESQLVEDKDSEAGRAKHDYFAQDAPTSVVVQRDPAPGSDEKNEKEGTYLKHDISVLRDLTKDEEFPLRLLEMLIGLNCNNRVVLAFDEKLAEGRDGKPLRSFLKAIENLKKNKRYKRILQNLEVIPAPVEELPSLLEGYAGKKNTKVFTFARKIKEAQEALNVLEAIDGVQTVYIDENNIPQNAYYPLAEIVTITLAQIFNPGIVEGKFRMNLDKINIESVKREGKAIIFTLLPEAEELNYQKLIKRYAKFKRFLKAV
ncbi:MAG: hypothetical protein ACE5JK_05235, partial [Candidatus Omnitrophota bacterium]